MISPLRVALVVPGGVDRSGRERVIPVLLWLIERLARRHELHVLVLHQYPQPCRYELLGATVHNLGETTVRVAGRRLPGAGLVRLWRRALRVLRAEGPWDVLHGFWGDAPGWLAAAAGRWLGVPAVVSLAGGEFVALPDVGYGMQLHWRTRLKVAQTLRLATRLTVSSGYMRDQVEARGVEPHVIPLGVDASCFASPRRDDGPPWRLLHVASLNEVKDPWTLLRALRRVVNTEPRVYLDVVGSDTLDGAVQAESMRLGLAEHVTFHGFLPTDALAPFWERAHLLVLPSRHDAAPVVVLEAAARALPTVGTRVGYVADWAGERAWAVSVGDDAALAEGILALLHDRDRREALGRAAQRWARTHDADWTAARFEALYRYSRER